MTTTADVIARAQTILYQTQRDPINRLNGAINNSVTTITLGFDLQTLTPGSIIEADLEQMYVWSRDTSALTAVVQRGFNGTTAASHVDQTIITVRPKFAKFDILQEINAELDGLPSQDIYAIDDTTFTYNPSIMSYELTGVTGINDIKRVEADIPGASRLWPELHSWKMRKSADTSDFSSTVSLTLYSPGSSGRDVRVIFSKDFTHLTNLTDDVQTTSGLPASANDILHLGAALRMSGYRETARNFYEAQGDTRRPEEVRSGAPTLAIANYARLYLTRIKQESEKLAVDYPIRRRLPA